MTVTLERARDHVGPGPSDDDLQAVLDAALEAIANRYGPDPGSSDDTYREHLRPFGQWVRLGRRCSAVDAVLEGTVALEDDDYEIWPGGRYLRRLSDDIPVSWTAWVDVTYIPLPEDSERDRVTLALIDLDLNRNPGLSGITVGPWSEQYTDSDGSYATDREAILSSLRPRMAGVW